MKTTELLPIHTAGIILLLLATLVIPNTGCSSSSNNGTDNTTGYRTSSAIPEFNLPPPPPVAPPQPVLPPAPVECSKVGCRAPGFTLESGSGKSVNLADYKGKKVFISFWPDGCKECEEQLHVIQQAYDQWPRTSVEILVINCKGDKVVVATLLSAKGYTFPVLFDRSGSINELYRNGLLPVTYLLDAGGNIAGIKEGLFKSIDEIDKFIGPKPCSGVGNKPGNLAPDFTLKDVNDVAVSLSSLRGKKVVLIFLQTACETCRFQMKHIQDAMATKSDKEWAVLFVAIRDSKEYIKRITILYSITLPILLDSNAEVNDKLYKPAHLPYTFFLNEYGCIRNVKDGYYENARQVLSYMDY